MLGEGVNMLPVNNYEDFPMADRRAYFREYMRKRRAEAKARRPEAHSGVNEKGVNNGHRLTITLNDIALERLQKLQKEGETPDEVIAMALASLWVNARAWYRYG